MLYSRHQRELIEYASRYSGDYGSAEDLVHDAWLKLDQHAQPSTVQEPLGYLKRIVRNLAIDLARRRKRRKTDGGEDLTRAASIIADDLPLQDATLIAQQDMELVLSAIAEMPERQREAIRAYHFEDLTLREVAERLGISRSMTHTLIRDGLKLCALRRARGR